MIADTLEAAPITARPWRTIWTSPRRTMRELLASEPRPSWALVVGLAALHDALATAGELASRGELSLSMAAVPTIVGVLQVVFGVLVGPFLLAFSGGWFGGQADPEEIRQALAWSYAPYALAAVYWIPVLFAGGGTAEPLPLDDPSAPILLQDLLIVAGMLVYVVALLWTVVLQVITLAEVQRFSIFRSLGSIGVWLVPVVLLTLLARLS